VSLQEAPGGALGGGKLGAAEPQAGGSIGFKRAVQSVVESAPPAVEPRQVGTVEQRARSDELCTESGDTINVPANAPHVFRNATDEPARLLCLCSPSGQEEFFAAVGVPVANRTQAPSALDAAATAAFIAKAQALAPRYRTELLLPGPSSGS
jgi:hypothetical protein